MSRRIRQQDLLPEATLLGQTIHIVGCGAIGSATALAVGKMAGQDVRLVLWDDDEVSEENLAVAFYRNIDIGRPKAEALAEIVQEFDGPTCEVRNRRVTEEDLLSGIVLSCTDSLLSRRVVLEAALKGGARFLVDGRMGSEVGNIHHANLADPKSVEAYRLTVKEGTRVLEEPCTGRAIVYTVFRASSDIVKIMKMYLTDVVPPMAIFFDTRYGYEVVEWAPSEGAAEEEAPAELVETTQRVKRVKVNGTQPESAV